MAKRIRRKWLVDRKVQLVLLLHSVVHWLIFLALGFGLLFAWELFLADVDRPLAESWQAAWTRHIPTAAVFLALLPAFVYDSLRLSNRFAGPIFRLRRAMHCLARGEDVQPISFRKRDFWPELADDLNAIATRLEASETFDSRHASMETSEREPELTAL